jgi:hypothetical protein
VPKRLEVRARHYLVEVSALAVCTRPAEGRGLQGLGLSVGACEVESLSSECRIPSCGGVAIHAV